MTELTDLSDLTVKFRETTTQISKTNAILKEQKAHKAELESQILNIFNEMGNGMYQMSTDAGTVSVKELTVGNVKDWDAFYAYIKENDAFHMLERRIANVSYREMLELEQDLPGVEPFTKQSISLTKGKQK